MGKRFLFIATCITSTLLLATSCLEKNDVYVKIPADQFFDFDLNQKISLSVDYGFKGKDYVVLFDLYDENPIIENENEELIKKDPFIVPPQIKMANFPARYKFSLLFRRFGYIQSMPEHSLPFS